MSEKRSEEKSDEKSKEKIEEFVHRFIPAVGESVGNAVTLLLLHGTGGDENDLLEIGRYLMPDANLLSPRGKVLERGMNRFFRRVTETVFDQEDLLFRTGELVQFIASGARYYGLDTSRVVAVGYSNGANITGSLLFRQPEVLAGAVLLHPMVPFEPETLPVLQGKPIFIGAGTNDPICQPSNTNHLVELLKASGAEVSLHWHNSGHSLSNAEIEEARLWIAERYSNRK